MQTRAKNDIFRPKNWDSFLAYVGSIDAIVSKPLSVKEALGSPIWKVAMDAEIFALY